MRRITLVFGLGSYLVACGDEEARAMRDCEHYVRICTDCGNCDGAEVCVYDEASGETYVVTTTFDPSEPAPPLASGNREYWDQMVSCARDDCAFTIAFDPEAPAPPQPCTRP
ncbi:MAG: hypothetical protein WC538_21150 [Thermoanaerobaculia bacterium]|jgi:hypothetical protein